MPPKRSSELDWAKDRIQYIVTGYGYSATIALDYKQGYFTTKSPCMIDNAIVLLCPYYR